MCDKLNILIERARGVTMTPEEEEKQRRSFAYGNTKIENLRITRDSVNQEAQQLAQEDEQKH